MSKNDVVLNYDEWQVTVDRRDPFYQELVATTKNLSFVERKNLVAMLKDRIAHIDRTADDFDVDSYCVDMAQLAYVNALVQH